MALLGTEVSEEFIASIIRLQRISQQGMLSVSIKSVLTLFQAAYSFQPEYGGDTFLRNVGFDESYTAPHPRRRHSSCTFIFLHLLWEAVVVSEAVF
jgi:hypothetical protein